MLTPVNTPPVSSAGVDQRPVQLAGLSLPGTPSQTRATQGASFEVVAALGFAAELKAPSASAVYKAIHLQSASERAEYRAYSEQIFASTISTPLAELSLDPKALLAMSAANGSSSESRVQPAVVNQATAPGVQQQAAAVVEGRVDGVLLPNLQSLHDVVSAGPKSPLADVVVPVGRILQGIKLAAETSSGFQLAA